MKNAQRMSKTYVITGKEKGEETIGKPELSLKEGHKANILGGHRFDNQVSLD